MKHFQPTILARLYEVKECLCDMPCARALARVRDQNVQFLRLGHFLLTTRDRGFIPGIHLHMGKSNRK